IVSSRTTSARPYPFRATTTSYCRASATNSSSRPAFTSITETESRVGSDSGNDLLQQGDELAADPPRCLHDLVVIERLRQHAGGHVGDARDAEHAQAHVPRRDRFGHCRHADRIGADGAKI